MLPVPQWFRQSLVMICEPNKWSTILPDIVTMHYLYTPKYYQPLWLCITSKLNNTTRHCDYALLLHSRIIPDTVTMRYCYFYTPQYYQTLLLCITSPLHNTTRYTSQYYQTLWLCISSILHYTNKHCYYALLLHSTIQRPPHPLWKILAASQRWTKCTSLHKTSTSRLNLQNTWPALPTVKYTQNDQSCASSHPGR